MSDRVFPSAKPAANGTTTTTPANPAPTPTTTKANLYNPTSRPPYRPQPHNRRRHRSGRSICCCCCFWSILIFLILLLLAAIAATALYVLYHPHRPEFTVPSFRIHYLNLTTAADASSSHLKALFNMTITSKNPNSHLSFFYDPLAISVFSGDVFLGNGTVMGYNQEKKNMTSFRNVVASGSNDLDADSVNSLRSDLKKKNGAVSLKMKMDTKVRVKFGGMKTKKIGIRVTCEEIKGSVPKGKSPTVAVTSGTKCKVDLRVKIWKWTF